MTLKSRLEKLEAQANPEQPFVISRLPDGLTVEEAHTQWLNNHPHNKQTVIWCNRLDERL